MAKTFVKDLVKWRDDALKAATKLDEILTDPTLKEALNQSGSDAKSTIIDAEYKLKDYANLLESIMGTTEIQWPPGN